MLWCGEEESGSWERGGVFILTIRQSAYLVLWQEGYIDTLLDW